MNWDLSKLYKNGFDPVGEGIFSIDGGRSHYPMTIEEIAGEDWWLPNRDNVLAGQSGFDPSSNYHKN